MNHLVLISMSTKEHEYLNNEKWLKRVDEHYKRLNVDAVDGDDCFMQQIDSLALIFEDDCPELIAKAREARKELVNALGLEEGVKLEKGMYIGQFAAFSEAEAAKFDKGEMTLIEKDTHALFDVLDRDKDGFLSLAEYKAYLIACAFSKSSEDEDEAKAAFNLIDKDNSGKLDKKEFAAACVKFWSKVSDDTEGLFGKNF